MIVQLNTPVPLETPKGRGMAHFIIDYGTEYDLIWVVFMDETGECWNFRNPEIRLQRNLTFGRQEPLKDSQVPKPPAERRGICLHHTTGHHIEMQDIQAVS